MLSVITRTTFRSPVLARSYASKGVVAAMKDKVLGAAETVDNQTGASSKAADLKQKADKTAEELKDVADDNMSTLSQTAGKAKAALGGAAETASNLAGKVGLGDPQVNGGQEFPPELKSDPYAGEKVDQALKAKGEDLKTTGKQAGYSGNLMTANPLVSGSSGGALDGGSSR